MQWFGDLFFIFIFCSRTTLLFFLHFYMIECVFCQRFPYCRVEIGKPSSEGTSCVGVEDF